ncbi:MAG: hypothetical protein JO029_01055 [Candidatus Eremiobacteraeota bacterium]|nr:hypothetical protein [Candidatus Eremiobacteraeota bacterium]MBV8720614.1 hypothetical protein [Candidatus Eremiobacteraeota bacterium]
MRTSGVIAARWCAGTLCLSSLLTGCSTSGEGAVPQAATKSAAIAPFGNKGGYLYALNQDGGQSGKGSVTVYAPGGSTPVRTITAGIDDPVALALDPTGNVYVANIGGSGNGSITVYRPRSTSVWHTIRSGLHFPPNALAFDPAGDLYVADIGYFIVYGPGRVTPKQVVRLNYPHGYGANSIAVRNGYVYAVGTEQNCELPGGCVAVFKAGASSPAYVITKGIDINNGVDYPQEVALDAKGDLYIANFSADTVTEYARGEKSPKRTIANAGLGAPGVLAFDRSGNLYVGGNAIAEYAPNDGTPIRTIEGEAPWAFAIDATGDLYEGNVEGLDTIGVFGPSGTSPSRKITQGVDQPVALALGSQ